MGVSLLEQQALLEPEPPRSVQIPRALLPVPSWWGVDSSTLRLNVGWVAREADLPEVPSADGVRAWTSGGFVRGAQAVKLGGVNENEGQRLDLISGQVDGLVEAMLGAGIPAPGVIWVEHPAGQHPKPQLYYAVGCTAAAIYRAVKRRVEYVPRVEFCTSGHWKLVACGSGKLPKQVKAPGDKKAKALPLEEYGVMKWARVNGYSGDSWDDADCLAMADAARRDVAIRG